MTVDFVLAHPTVRFWATEAEKVALLRGHLIQEAVWPHRQYPSRRSGGVPTVRYFVDKMPWYQVGDDPRLWIAYVDAERTLQGFETFLDQYRALLASLPSGVTYAAPSVWQGAIQAAFTKTFESRDRTLIARFLEYCELRRQVEDAERYRPLTPDQHRRFRERCADFLTPAFDALYRKELDTSTLSSAEVYAAAFPACLLRVHALGHRYHLGRAPRSSNLVAER
jgi:hypothetical protein